LTIDLLLLLLLLLPLLPLLDQRVTLSLACIPNVPTWSPYVRPKYVFFYTLLF